MWEILIALRNQSGVKKLGGCGVWAAFLYVIVSGQQFTDVSWERGSEGAGEGEERAKVLL